MRTWLDDPRLTAEVASDLEGERREANGFNEAYLRLYHNVPLTGLDGERDGGVILLKTFAAVAKRRGYNLMREMLDGSAAQICRKVAAKLTPVGGDFEVYRNCRTMNRLIDGVTDHLNAYAFMRRAFRDAQKCDIGAVYVGMDAEGEFFLERWDPLWVLWPDSGCDGTDGTADGPRTLMYVDAVPKANLKALYPKHAAAIDSSLPDWDRPKVAGVHKGPRHSKYADTVKLVRACAKAVGKEPGRFVIACENGLVLEDKPWPYKRHPVVIFRWDWNHGGYGGTPLAEILEPYHSRVKANVRTIDQCLKGARPVVFVPEDRWEDAKFSDLPFTKIPHDPGGPPPTVVPLQTVPADLLQSVERDYARAAAESGHSQALTAGMAPTSITSGKGLREYVAIANQRLSDKQAMWEQGWCDLAHVIVMLGNANYQHVKVRAQAPQSDWLEEIEWLSPEALREDQYKITYKPTTGVSNTVAGMYEDIEYIKGSGVPVTPAEITRLVASNVPDVASLADRLNAPMDLAEQMIDQALHGEQGSVVPMPTAMQGPSLHTMLEIAKQRYQQSLARRNVPRWRKQRLRRLIAMVEARLAPPPTAPANPQPVPEPPLPVIDPNAPPPPEMAPDPMAPPMVA